MSEGPPSLSEDELDTIVTDMKPSQATVRVVDSVYKNNDYCLNFRAEAEHVGRSFPSG